MVRRALPLLLLALVACNPRPGDNPPPVHLDCNVVTESCLLPWPSSVHERVDATTASGLVLDLSEEASFGGFRDTLLVEPPDGFSPIGAIATLLPDGGMLDDLPGEYLASVREDSAVVVVDADATSESYGRRMPFLAQLVDSAEGSALLVLTPLEAFAPSGRYAVVVTDRLRDGAGATPTPTARMEQLLGLASVEADMEPLADYYGDLVRLAKVELEIPPEEIVQLWDFHVRSEAGMVADWDSMQAQGTAWIADGPPAPRVVFERRVAGHDRFTFDFDVPLWRADRFDRLNRGADGAPEPVGELEITGYLLVPDSATPETPATPILFGHGLGVHSEQMEPTLAGFDLDSGPYAIAAFDLDLHGDRGDELDDIVEISGTLNFAAFSAAMLQSSVDQLVATAAMQALPDLPDRGDVVADGPIFYLGQSLGGLAGAIGGTANARLEASVFNVTGGGLANILRLGEIVDAMGTRPALESVVERDPPTDFPADLGYDVLLVAGQVGLDEGDPINYAHRLQADRFAGEPFPVLLQESMNDGIVPNPTTEALARRMELILIEPAQEGAPGLERADAPTCGSPDSGLFQFYTSHIPFEAHLALEEPEVHGQAFAYFSSFIDDDPGNDGNIAFPPLGTDCP